MARGTHYSAYEDLTVSDTAGGFTTATIVRTEVALVTVETAQVRFRLDGTAPTPTVGHILGVGDVLEIDSSEALGLVRFIRTGGTSGIGYLAKELSHTFFPELWTVRTRL